MKRKWIRMAIGRKVDAWLNSISDTQLREQVSKNVIVTGGCIVSMLLGEEVNDFDIYLRDRSLAKRLAEYYVAKFKANPPQSFKNNPEKLVNIHVKDEDDRIKIVVRSSGVAGESGSQDYQCFASVPGDEDQAAFIDKVTADAKEIAKPEEDSKREKYRPVFLSANCITLSDKVQVIFRFFGEPQGIHANYDFVHCTCWWDSADRSLHLPPEALESILAKDLRYVGQSKYPVCAMVRIRKFLARGWHITAGQMLKIMWDINRLNLSDLKVLEDQLVGVDTAYFLQLIDALSKRNAETVDGAYLMELIDKIF